MVRNLAPDECTASAFSLPHRIEVADVISSRYGEVFSESRPAGWDERFSGMDIVRTVAGEEVALQSSAMQSVPKVGWVLMLTGGDRQVGYEWTLYGISRSLCRG